ncbi:MAG: hypothetical protein EXR00_07265 [Alphaproteobacteria bacterium]|nr:hypothetical protein [Alphaproteobacteria bacterium]
MSMALKYRARLCRTLCHAFGAAALAMCAGVFATSGVSAAEVQSADAGSPPPARDFGTYVPTGRATRIEPTEAPTIDGLLDDAAWAKAQVIDEFYQLDPGTGQPGSERTELRILYDSENLYVGIYNFDREAHLISATNRGRDSNLGVDDSVRIYLDPLNSRRNSYFFEVNAAGARQEALIQNNADFFKEWNTIWAAKVQIVDDGWIVEMALPFGNFAFDPTKPDWVFDLLRTIKRKGERIRWNSIAASTPFGDISRSGTLTGISGIDAGLGLDIQLFASTRYRFDWQQPQREIISARLSGNAFYKITPTLTGTLTVNPDFSDAPLDIRQVNTTRFALFQPETRNFFLQDAAAFEFGGHGFSADDNYMYQPDNARPFFSRNIGLANGLPVSIISGGKLSGEYGGIGIGALSVVTNGTGITQRSQILNVARITAQIGESKAGIIVTNGDPSGLSKNSVAGADFQYRDSNFLPGKVFQSDFYYQRSFSDIRGDDDSLGAALFFPNEPLGGEAHYKQVGRNFSPALGFVNRTNIRQYDGRIQYRRRDLGFRWFDVGTTWYAVTGLNNHLESRENGIYINANNRFQDEYTLRLFNNFEDVPATFRLAGRVPVNPGRYSWTNVNAFIQTSNGRPYSVKLNMMCCSFYNGTFFRADLRGDFRPNALIQIAPHYTYTHIDLPTGLVNIHLLATDFILNFSTDMQLSTQLQYDNISEDFALSLRYRWEYEPGQELFATIGQSAVIPGEPTFVPQSTQAAIRLGHTFRF